MREEQIVTFYLIGLSALSLLTIALFSGAINIDRMFSSVYVKNYEVNISFPYITESYEYHIDSPHHDLFRNWNSEVSCMEKPETIVPVSISCPDGFTGYARDSNGKFCFGHADSYYSRPGEAGCYNSSGFGSGDYRMSLRFKTLAPSVCNSTTCAYEILLASEHVPYMHAKVSGAISIFPPKHSFSSPANNPIDVVVLTSNNGKPSNGNPADFVSKLKSKGKWTYSLLKYSELAVLLISISLPLIFYLLYNKFGKEKQFIMPNVLNYVPNKDRKPWIVNAVFSGMGGGNPVDSYAATLLDLSMREKIKLTPVGDKDDPDDLEMEVLDTNGLDIFEQAIVDNIKEHGGKARVSDILIERPSKATFIRQGLRIGEDYMTDTLKLGKYMLNEEKKFMEFNHYNTVIGLLGIFFTPAIPFLLAMATGISSAFINIALWIVVAQFGLFIAIPPKVFSRWKGEERKEFLQWQAFKKFLSDEAMIKKYSLRDMNIWKEWLVYGTALGVGRKIARIMKELNIDIPERSYAPAIISTLNTSISNMYVSSGGGFSGGFGGGGAGAR